MSKYVAGAGISGLLWGYYHPDYDIVTDEFGRVVTGADPVVWLNDTDLTRKLLSDLGLLVKPVRRLIGYRSTGAGGEGTQSFEELSLDSAWREVVLDRVLIKKMIPWEAIEAALYSGIALNVKTPSRTFTKDSGTLSYLDVEMKEVVEKLVDAVKFRVHSDRRLVQINDGGMATKDCGWEYEHLVSTLPAPIFKRIWHGEKKLPALHHCPVSYVVSDGPPTWWDDRFAVVYDADMNSPVSRVGRFRDTWRYEFTGRPDDDTLNEYMPVPQGRFVNPFGRIVQDVKLESPSERITFLGRIAEWDYRGLIDRTLERVHGRR